MKCIDSSNNNLVAIKVIKSQSVYTAQAKKEIDILQQINHEDENDEFGIGMKTLKKTPFFFVTNSFLHFFSSNDFTFFSSQSSLYCI